MILIKGGNGKIDYFTNSTSLRQSLFGLVLDGYSFRRGGNFRGLVNHHDRRRSI